MKELDRQNQIAALHNVKQVEINELIEYNANYFQFNDWDKDFSVPLEDELHLPAWQKYCVEAEEIGVLESLKKRLVQLNFTITKDISSTQQYRQATRKGELILDSKKNQGLKLESNELELRIHQTIAGKIPVIIAKRRSDFVALIQALTKKNEPQPIPNSMGACIVGGYNNWDRIRQYRQRWSDRASPQNSEADWQIEFKKLIPQKKLYQDRFIILSCGNYSDVNSEDLGLKADRWQELSLEIRLEHECTHYLTRRLLGSMRNNLLDETIADYRGIVAATGSYRGDWFLRFMGLEGDSYRYGGRLENYRGNPELSDGAFKVLQKLIQDVAKNLEEFDRQYYRDRDRTELEKLAVFLALSNSTIIDLAAVDGIDVLLRQTTSTKDKLKQLNISFLDNLIPKTTQN